MMKLNIQMFASTNKTANYELPQFVGTDKPTWLGDFNTAMTTIDGGMAENKSNIESMDSRVSSTESTASQASQNVSALTTRVSAVESSVSSATTTANNAQSTATTALNTANTANGKADTNASAITTIESNVSALQTETAGLKGKVLWTNPNPNNPFNSQTITLNSSDYDLLEIFYYDYDSLSERGCLSARVIKGKNTTLQSMFRDGNDEFIGERKIKYTSDTKLSVLDNYSIVRANSFDRKVYNDWNVPIYVIGYNTGLF